MAYSVNSITVLRLQCAPGSVKRARARAPTHTRAPGSPPPDVVRGGGDPGGARVVWVWNICVYMSQVTSVADAVSAPVAGSDPTPRSAALRFGVGSLNPGPTRAVASAWEARPCGVPAKGAAALGRRSPAGPRRFSAPRRRGFPRVAVLRLAPLRCARSTRPPLGPLSDLGRRCRCEAFPSCRPLIVRRARTFVLGRGPRKPLRGRVSDSDGLLPRPRTPGGVRL